ncbi:MAG TPA: glycosyltransferase family 1 protein [Thermoanaerobaculia bacterium]|nr:glycosyltransferase family 1 protein [Thermoanaerobaculia bacterium]
MPTTAATPAAASALAATPAALAPRPPVPRVAIDLRALVPPPTGIGVYTRSLAIALAHRAGMRYLGVAHRPPRGAEELMAAGIDLEQQRAPLGVVWQQLALPWRLRRGDVDLLWSPLLTLPLACPVPAVATIHDLTVLLFPEAHRAKVRASLLPFLAASLREARRLVTLSRATAADLAEQFPGTAGKVRVVYPGVDDEFRPAGAEEIAATRAALGAPRGYLLYAGTLEPRKNVGALLDAWEALAADDPSFPPLVLAGPYGWGSRALARRIARLAAGGGTAPGTTLAPLAASAGSAAGATGARLLALGRLDRAALVKVFQAASLFVYPSLYEGFGLPPAEALACGVPAVALDTSSLPEVVGDAGVLVPPGDTAALAAALARLIADPGRAAELAGRAVAQAGRFRWPRAAAEMEEVFRDALG